MSHFIFYTGAFQFLVNIHKTVTPVEKQCGLLILIIDRLNEGHAESYELQREIPHSLDSICSQNIQAT